MQISVIGTGNVAYHMVRAIHQSALHLACICGRTIDKAKAIVPDDTILCVDIFEHIPVSDVILICISDKSISSVAQQLSTIDKHTRTIIAHTSGSISSDVLSYNKHHGVFYPLQTFTKEVELDYASIPLCICANTTKNETTLLTIAKSITERVYRISDEQRLQLHVSAVIANNFINHIVHLSQQRLSQQNIDTEILTPLIDETIRKIKLSPAYDNQTGPARRNDQKVIEKHLALLAESPTLQHLYKTISESIINTYHENNRRNTTSKI